MDAVGTLSTATAEDVGLDSFRLRRIGEHFRGYCERGQLAGALLLVQRRGAVAYLETLGHQVLETDTPLAPDSIFRVYSMTKPVVSVAAMMLYEEGRFQLDDPVSRYIPSFADMRVWTGGGPDNCRTEPAVRPVTVRHLLTHTSGLTYAFMQESPFEQLYAAAGLQGARSRGSSAEVVDRLAALPLRFQPGTQWHYSMATDVVGRLVEVWSGESLDDHLARRIFAPLGMADTGFVVPADKLSRLCGNYGLGPDGRLRLIDDPADSIYAKRPGFLSGGGGLVSTAADYLRFASMLRGGGALDGVRLLGPRTLAFMASNHLDGDIADNGMPVFGNAPQAGIGFGLGFSVVVDPVKMQVPTSRGEFGWTGAASTAFWVDPVEDMIVIQLAQFMPSARWNIRRELRSLVYQAIVD